MYGSGGLLICYSNILKGNGKFSSFGGHYVGSWNTGWTGGGSINLFYGNCEGNFTYSTNAEKVLWKAGTTGAWYMVKGVDGYYNNAGSGTATVGSIQTGKFLEDF